MIGLDRTIRAFTTERTETTKDEVRLRQKVEAHTQVDQPCRPVLSSVVDRVVLVSFYPSQMLVGPLVEHIDEILSNHLIN